MNIVTPGVALSRRPFGEYGRMAVIYTRDVGKVTARFAGVDRPRAKLKAFAEPMVCAEYRLYLRPASAWATVTGGRIMDSYSGLRLDLDRMLGGLEMCELLLRLTPERSPNPKKYELITGFLAAFAEFPAPCLPIAFGLRLLELLGLGPGESGDGFQETRQRLVSGSPQELVSAQLAPLQLVRLREFVNRSAEAYLQRPLNAPRVRASIGAAP